MHFKEVGKFYYTDIHYEILHDTFGSSRLLCTISDHDQLSYYDGKIKIEK